MRAKRKQEHIENFLKSTYKGDTLFDDVFIEHNALPELSLEDIDTSHDFIGRKVGFPLLINAMTGGSDMSSDINEDLARLAKEFNLPMAVGSETVALEDHTKANSFKVVREILGDDFIVIGNVSASSKPEMVQQASDLIHADAMQLHLNSVQELVMEEGDRDFRNIIDNIENIVKTYDKPIIVKEVGFGISKECAAKLYNIGVRHIDIAGCGGTNFIEIENIRRFDIDFSDIYSWGIPTAKAIINCRELPQDLSIIASGGIKSSMDLVKALILGGDIVGVSGELLSFLIHGGYESARDYLEGLIYKTKILMLLLGKKNIKELRTTDYTITGRLKDIK